MVQTKKTARKSTGVGVKKPSGTQVQDQQVNFATLFGSLSSDYDSSDDR